MFKNKKVSGNIPAIVTAVFLIFGFSWIWISDLLLFQLTDENIKSLSLIKGSIFIILSGLIVFNVTHFLLKRERLLLKKNERKTQSLERAEFKAEQMSGDYQILFDKSPVPMWIYDKTTLQFLAVNEAAIRSYGYSKEDFLKMTGKDIRPDEDVSSYLKAISPDGTQYVFSGIWRHKRKNGEIFFVEVHSDSVIFKGKECRLILSIDITQKKVAEEQFNITNSNLNALIENTDDYIWSIDKDNKLTGFNRNFRNIYRDVFKKEVEIGMDFQGLTSERELGFWNELRERALTGKRFKTEYQLNFGRNLRFFELSYNPIKEVDGKPTGAIAIQGRDITLQKKTIRDLVYKNNELDTFVYKVSHDLIGPIASMKGLCNIALMEIANSEAASYYNMILERLDRLQNVVMTLIQLTRIKEGDLLSQDLSFSEILDEIITTYENYPGKENINLKYDIDLGQKFQSDPILVKTILQNLIENSIKYRDERKLTEVTIHISKDSNMIQIEVSDNGVGIPDEFQEKIFNMFFRADERSQGSGLGLYIVKNAVDKLEGWIDLKSKVKEGTTFTVSIPEN